MARVSPLFIAALALCLALLPLRLDATTVVPPAFDSLVAQSDYVVHAVVKSVTSEWQVTQGHRNIITKVTLEIKEVITGNPPQTPVLEMLGGQVGNQVMRVEGAPQFQVGQEDILFVQGNGTQFSPLVAVMHGRYPVLHDPASGQAYVARNNGTPLYSETEVSLPMEQAVAHPEGSQPLTPSQFIGLIRQSFQKAQAQQMQR